MKVIINADDFGASKVINAGIVEAFSRKIVTNTTIMANVPFYDEAVELAKENGFFDKVGIHLNLSAGQPLTQRIKKEALFYDDSKNELTLERILHKRKLISRFFLPRHTRQALEEECKAQILKYINTGFTELHLDSHQHTHTIPSVWFSIRKVLKIYGIKTIRKSYNLRPHASCGYVLYKTLFNNLAYKKFKTTEYFTSARSFVELMKSGGKKKNRTCEIMIHPFYEEGKLMNSEAVCFDEFSDLLKDYTLISYQEL